MASVAMELMLYWSVSVVTRVHPGLAASACTPTFDHDQQRAVTDEESFIHFEKRTMSVLLYNTRFPPDHVATGISSVYEC